MSSESTRARARPQLGGQRDGRDDPELDGDTDDYQDCQSREQLLGHPRKHQKRHPAHCQPEGEGVSLADAIGERGHRHLAGQLGDPDESPHATEGDQAQPEAALEPRPQHDQKRLMREAEERHRHQDQGHLTTGAIRRHDVRDLIISSVQEEHRQSDAEDPERPDHPERGLPAPVLDQPSGQWGAQQKPARPGDLQDSEVSGPLLVGHPLRHVHLGADVDHGLGQTEQGEPDHRPDVHAGPCRDDRPDGEEGQSGDQEATAAAPVSRNRHHGRRGQSSCPAHRHQGAGLGQVDAEPSSDGGQERVYEPETGIDHQLHQEKGGHSRAERPGSDG